MPTDPTPPPPSLDAFERLARARRATRRFRPDPVPPDLLARVTDAARWAPSGYNLQPTHLVVVTDPAVRRRLRAACMDQRPVEEAPAVVVFAGDRRVADHHFDRVIAMDRAAGAIKPEYEALLRRVVPLAFGTGPVGLGWLWKATLVPLVRRLKPLPDIPAVDMRFWLAKQAAMAAMTLMLAAEAAGLATLPMEGFDERRVRRVLGIPRWCHVPLVVAVGYADETVERRKTRLPAEELVHRDRW